VLRPSFFAALGGAASVTGGRGPTLVSMPSKPTGWATRMPQFGQKPLPGAAPVPPLVQGAPLPPAFGGLGGVFWSGRGVTGPAAAPHRLHCGTPIGVSALHASQTRPTSIKSEILPPRERARQRRLFRRSGRIGPARPSGATGGSPDDRVRIARELAAPLLRPL